MRVGPYPASLLPLTSSAKKRLRLRCSQRKTPGGQPPRAMEGVERRRIGDGRAIGEKRAEGRQQGTLRGIDSEERSYASQRKTPASRRVRNRAGVKTLSSGCGLSVQLGLSTRRSAPLQFHSCIKANPRGKKKGRRVWGRRPFPGILPQSLRTRGGHPTAAGWRTQLSSGSLSRARSNWAYRDARVSGLGAKRMRMSAGAEQRIRERCRDNGSGSRRGQDYLSRGPRLTSRFWAQLGITTIDCTGAGRTSVSI